MFLPDNIDLGRSEKYILTIRIKPDGFSFSIHDPEDKNCYCFLETVFSIETTLGNNIQRIIFDHNFLTNTFKQTNVVIVSPKYDIIPKAFYDKNKTKELYSFSHNNESGHIITSAKSTKGNEIIFDFDETIYLFLQRSLYVPTFYHHISLLIDYFGKKSVDSKTSSMFINFHESFIDLICFNEQGNIIHSHTYYKEHEQDMIYYILNCWEKSKFDQLSDNLYIYGCPSSYQTEKALKEYIKHITTVGQLEELTDFGEKVQQTPLDISALLI